MWQMQQLLLGKAGQGPTARSTPEAELYALDHAVHHLALPLCMFWGMLLRRLVPVVVMEDNEPCIAAVAKGVSRKLSYVTAKKERVSVSTLHELFFGDPHELDEETPHLLLKVASEIQNADFFTKPLESDEHWANAWRVALRTIQVSALTAAEQRGT